MNKKLTVALGLALACTLPVACKKKTEDPAPPAADPAAPQADSRAALREALGFAARVPADVDGYTSAHNLAGLADSLARSGLLDRLTSPSGALPAGAPALDAARKSPVAQRALSLARALLGKECFLVQSPGFYEQFTLWRAMAEEARVGRSLGALKNQRDSGAAIREAAPYLVPLLGKLEVPPMVLGFRAGDARAEIDAAVAELVAQIPPGPAQDEVDVPGVGPMRRITLEAEKLITPEQRIRIETFLRESLGNAGLASDAAARLLTRRAECLYGWSGDYFLVSLGTGHAHLRLAADEAGSLLALPGIEKGKPHLAHPVRLFSYLSPEGAKPLMAGIAMLPYFERMRPALEMFLKTPDLAKIESAIAGLDKKAESLAPQAFEPCFQFAWAEKGFRAEIYGGLRSPALAEGGPGRIAGAMPEGSTLWWRALKNPDYDQRFAAWFEELCTLAWGFWQEYGVAQLPAAQRSPYAMAEQLALPKLQELYRITRDEFAKGVGPDEAFALDLNGKVPPLPNVPAGLVGRTLLPRFTWARSLADPASLEKASRSYGAVVGQSMALMPPQMQMMGALLSPVSADRGGLTFYSVPALTVQGDFVPHVASGPDLWFLGTSPDYTSAVAASAARAEPEDYPSVARVQFDSTPLASWLETFAEAAAADPAGLVPNRPDAGLALANNGENIRAIAGLIRDLGIALDYRYGYEGGAPRSSLFLRANTPEKPPR